MFVDYEDSTYRPRFSEFLELDLATVVPCVSGPKRPQDKVELSQLHTEFRQGLVEKVSFKGFGLQQNALDAEVPVTVNGESCTLRHGSVVISAITSCTNTSNPSVMLGAGVSFT